MLSDYCNVPHWRGIIPSSVSICFTLAYNFTFWGKERFVFLWDCQRLRSLISMSVAWNRSQIQPVILKWFSSFIVWISPLFLANSVCENVHSCIYQWFLHLTGLAGSHLSFIRRILQTRTPWKEIKPFSCCCCWSWVCCCWEDDKCCAWVIPRWTHVPLGGVDVTVSLSIITCHLYYHLC